jgi:hypothetical protein
MEVVNHLEIVQEPELIVFEFEVEHSRDRSIPAGNEIPQAVDVAEQVWSNGVGLFVVLEEAADCTTKTILREISTATVNGLAPLLEHVTSNAVEDLLVRKRSLFHTNAIANLRHISVVAVVHRIHTSEHMAPTAITLMRRKSPARPLLDESGRRPVEMVQPVAALLW